MLSFGTDAWTSPNSKAYVAVTVHLEQNGVPLGLLLDIVEVAESHSGKNLAAAFAKILKDFGIAEKVSLASHFSFKKNTHYFTCARYSALHATTLLQMIQ